MQKDDLIYRQAVIDTIKKSRFLYDAMRKVAKLPSAQPELKKGKWIPTNDGWDGEYFVCSKCGCPWTLIEGSPEDNGMNFCPNCGAYMREVDDGKM